MDHSVKFLVEFNVSFNALFLVSQSSAKQWMVVKNVCYELPVVAKDWSVPKHECLLLQQKLLKNVFAFKFPLVLLDCVNRVVVDAYLVILLGIIAIEIITCQWHVVRWHHRLQVYSVSLVHELKEVLDVVDVPYVRENVKELVVFVSHHCVIVPNLVSDLGFYFFVFFLAYF